jgi:hypothetical protein
MGLPSPNTTALFPPSARLESAATSYTAQRLFLVCFMEVMGGAEAWDGYSENRFAQEEGEVRIGCVGIYVNDVYAMTAHDSCMCTRQLHGLFQEIYTNICLKYKE